MTASTSVSQAGPRGDSPASAPTNHERLAFDSRRSADQDAAAPVRHPVVIVGAGPVGLTLAIDLAQRGVPVVLLDDDDTLATGSRAICFAKRTLEIFDRLGCGDRMASMGVSWQRGRVFFGDAEVYHFDLLAEESHERPAFVNLQQYYVEGFLVERAAELPLIDLRWRHAVVGVKPQANGVLLEVDTPDGRYAIDAAYVAACDGSRSPIREALGLSRRGRAFRDRFLIADVRMQIDLPTERWFWFDPTFHPNQSALLHRQPDGVWRLDFQLGWDADPERKSPSTSRRSSARCSPPPASGRCRSNSSGRASTASPAHAWRTSVTAASSLPAMPRTASRRSALAARIRACRMPTTSAGNSRSRCSGMRPRRCSIPTPANARRRQTTTSATRRVRPTSSRRRARSAACSAMRC